MTRHPIAVLLLLFAGPAGAWWNCDWNQRFPADIDAPNGPAQANYAVRLDLGAASVPASFDWSTNGADLRVIDQDDLTPLPFMVEQWDSTARTAVLWVTVPVLQGVRRVYLYFDGPTGAVAEGSLAAMPQVGMKFHTRRSFINPINRTTAELAFAAGGNVGGYGCTSVASYVGVNNSGTFAPPTRQNDIALFAEAFFEVQPGEAGVWEFRYGADFGYGGGLYVDDVALEEDWNANLWWDYNWNNAGGVLQGSLFLGAGMHSIRILGFEDCCDGGLTVQFRRPGGPWLDMTQANMTFRARQCSNRPEPTVSYGPGQVGSCPDLDVLRSSQPYSDPVNGTSGPRAIPSAVMLNTTEIRNAGVGSVDAGTLMLTEVIDTGTALRVADFDASTSGPVRFIDGASSSGLSYTFGSLGDTGDDLSFSNDGGATFTYVPSPDGNGLDLAVTHIRITATGTFAGNGGAGYTSAQFLFKTQIR